MRVVGFLAAVGIGAAAIAMPAAAKDWKTVNIATEGAYEPWNFVEAGQVKGFEVDLAQDLCKRMQVTCTVVAQDWDGLIPGLNAGKYDVIMASMNITPKRLEVIDFSRPYAVVLHGFAVQKSGPLANLAGTGKGYSLSDDADAAKKVIDEMAVALKGKTLGAQTGTVDSAFLQKYFGSVATIREYKTTEQHDLDLTTGRIDAVFTGIPALMVTIDKSQNALALAGAQFKSDVFGNGIGAGIRKGDPELRAMFDKAIGAAIADGTLQKLSTQWLKTDVTPK
jgi:octopine/nopaline transport system substrate-binding protein